MPYDLDFNSPAEVTESLLGADAHLVVNKKLVAAFGLDAAVLFADLLSKRRYFRIKGQLEDGEWFYSVEAHRQQCTGLTPYRQSAALTILQQAGFLTVQRRGIHARQWIKINDETIHSVFLKFKGILLKNLRSTTLYNKNIIKLPTVTTAFPAETSSFSHQIESTPIPEYRRLRPIPKPPPPPPPSERYSIPRGSPAYAFVREWNEAPGPHQQHNLAAHTKVLDAVGRLHRQLVRGGFWRGRIFDEHWLRNNPQLEKQIKRWATDNKTFSPEELRSGLRAAMLYYLEGYWPADKGFCPKSLPDLIYNPRTQTSWLLKAMIIPPQKLSPNAEVKELSPELTERALELIGRTRQDPYVVRDVDVALRGLAAAWDKTTDAFAGSASGEAFCNQYQHWGHFIKDFLDWFEDQDWIKERNPSALKPSSGIAGKWFSRLKAEFDYGDGNFRIIY